MATSNFAKRWKTAKSNFTKATGTKKPPVKTVKVLAFTLNKGSGIENALAKFDAAVKKGHRKDVAIAYQEAWKLGAAYANLLGAVGSKLPLEDPMINELIKLATALNVIISELPNTLEEVQQEKGNALKVQQLLADLEGQLKEFDKAVKADKQAKEAEKEYKIAKSADKTLKALKEYTVAAGRADVAKAKQALDDYDAASRVFENNCQTVFNLVNGLIGYGKYAAALKDLQKLAYDVRIGRAEIERKTLAATLGQVG